MERERKQRRDAIIRIAEGFFLDQGYEKTMVDQIALEAGYSKATIYNYFESKDDLFIAVVAKAFDKLFQVLAGTLTEGNKEKDLLALGDAYLIYVKKYPNYAGLFSTGQLSLVMKKIISKESKGQSLTESEREFRGHQLKIQELMTNIITETMKKARLKTKIDPLTIVMVLSALNSAIIELVLRGQLSGRPEGKSKEYITVLFNIIDKGLKHYDD